MSNTKLLFFITLWVLSLVGIWFLITLMNRDTSLVDDTTASLSVWIVGDTSEGYAPIISGFQATYPEYKNIKIEFKKFASWRDYHRTIMSVLANNEGPDIFVVPEGEDSFLIDRIAPLPEWVVDTNQFLREYEGFFIDDLITETDNTGSTVSALRGVPLGYETLGIFYNKDIIPTPPKTWDELDQIIDGNLDPNVVPFGIGLSPRFIPEAAEIIVSLSPWVTSFEWLSSSEWWELYRSYAERVSTQSEAGEKVSLMSLIPFMNAESPELTVYDLFMRGKVGAIFGYPSTVRNIELAKKRAGGSAVDSIILTAGLPVMKNDVALKYPVSYWYFAISSQTKNARAAWKFLRYLMSDDAEKQFLKSFPTYIAAKTSFHDEQRDTSLSSMFARAKLWNFMGENRKYFSFQYGLKSDFDSYLNTYMERSKNISMSTLLRRVSEAVQCEIDHIAQKRMEVECGQE